jgi:hypothetical protein
MIAMNGLVYYFGLKGQSHMGDMSDDDETTYWHDFDKVASILDYCREQVFEDFDLFCSNQSKWYCKHLVPFPITADQQMEIWEELKKVIKIYKKWLK